MVDPRLHPGADRQDSDSGCLAVAEAGGAGVSEAGAAMTVHTEEEIKRYGRWAQPMRVIIGSLHGGPELKPSARSLSGLHRCDCGEGFEHPNELLRHRQKGKCAKRP
jgi:hypothetical protein